MYQRMRKHLMAGFAILFALTLAPAASFAQSVDDCMSAGTSDALNICKSILDNGSRNIDVFWKLSSAQFQNGQPDLANKTLDEALRLYPDNRKLVALRAIIDSEATEQALIARSAQLNQNSLDKGAMKMTCLTKSGEEAITACKRRLDLTDDDGDRMRARLAVLESQQAPSVAATATEPRSTADDSAVVATAPVVEPSTHNTSTTQSNEQLAAQARKQAYRQLVTDIQLQLNHLGFNAGVPDGIPGTKTREAIAEFYSAMGAPINMSIDDITLEDLNAEKRKLTVARQLLQQSEQALQQGNTPMAVQRLTDAKTASALLKVPLQYEQQVRDNSIATVTVEPAAPVRTEKIQPQSPPATGQVNTPITPAPSIGSTQQFAELMGRISVLQGQIIRKQEESQQNLEQIRNAL